jgi:hypothetical protein
VKQNSGHFLLELLAFDVQCRFDSFALFCAINQGYITIPELTELRFIPKRKRKYKNDSF